VGLATWIYKANLNEYRKSEITPCILSEHNTIKLEFNNKRNNRKYSNPLRLNKLLHDQWVTKEIRDRNQKVLRI
jgi:hypothetical protein